MFSNEIACETGGIGVCANDKAVKERHKPLATAKFDPARTIPPAKQGTFKKGKLMLKERTVLLG